MAIGGRLTEDRRILRSQIERPSRTGGSCAVGCAHRASARVQIRSPRRSATDLPGGPWVNYYDARPNDCKRKLAWSSVKSPSRCRSCLRNQIVDLLEELRSTRRHYCSHVLDAALDAADPLTAGAPIPRRVPCVVDATTTIDPGVARTFANATFMARRAARKGDVSFQTLRGSDDAFSRRGRLRLAPLQGQPSVLPIRSKPQQAFITDYDAIVAELTSSGVESNIARSLAAIASLSARALPDRPQTPAELRGRPCFGERDASAGRAKHRSERVSATDLFGRAPLHEQLRHRSFGSSARRTLVAPLSSRLRPFDRTIRCAGRSVIWRSSKQPV